MFVPGVYDYGPRMRERYRLQWRLDHDARETLVQSNNAGSYIPRGWRRRHSIWRRNVSGSHGDARNPGSRRATARAATGTGDPAAAAILPRWLLLLPSLRLLLPAPGPAEPGAIKKSLPDRPPRLRHRATIRPEANGVSHWHKKHQVGSLTLSRGPSRVRPFRKAASMFKP